MYTIGWRSSLAAAFTLAAAVSLPSAGRAQGGFNGPGRYEITNVKSGKVLALDRSDHTTVIQFSPRNNSNQYWDIREVEGGYWFIRPGMTGGALECMSVANSTPARATPFTGTPSQQWRITAGKDGNALITNRLGKTLDIPNGTDREGARVNTYEINGEANQRFKFRRIGDMPRYDGDRDRDRDQNRDRRWDAYSGRFDERDHMWKLDGDGVCFYRERGYMGRAFCVRAGEDIARLPDQWVGVFQSVKFFGHVRAVEVFGEADFGGSRMRIEREQPDLDRFRSRRGEPFEHHVVSFRVE
jgi:hypothetical protein